MEVIARIDSVTLSKIYGSATSPRRWKAIDEWSRLPCSLFEWIKSFSYFPTLPLSTHGSQISSSEPSWGVFKVIPIHIKFSLCLTLTLSGAFAIWYYLDRNMSKFADGEQTLARYFFSGAIVISLHCWYPLRHFNIYCTNIIIGESQWVLTPIWGIATRSPRDVLWRPLCWATALTSPSTWF